MRNRVVAVVGMLLTVVIAPASTSFAQPTPTPLGWANSASLQPALSADGRYVAFSSDASNLVEGDTNETTDVFVHDRETGRTIRVSVASDGTQANRRSSNPDISGDGRLVIFESDARNLDEFSTPGIFVHDLETGVTRRVSVASDGTPGNATSHEPVISADGRWAAFWSNASNLIEDDTNFYRDVFVHNLETGETRRVSVASDGTEANEDSFDVDISGDGRYVAFWSHASNIVPDDTNGEPDIFVHDLETGETTRVNVSSAGEQANGYTFESVSLSADGRFVAFHTQATNLIADDNDNANDVYVHDRETGETIRVSLPATDRGDASDAVLSGDGQIIAYDTSVAADGDTDDTWDVYIFDRETETQTRISVFPDGRESSVLAGSAAISQDGQVIAFETGEAFDLGDFNFTTDIYVYDRRTGQLSLASVPDRR